MCNAASNAQAAWGELALLVGAGGLELPLLVGAQGGPVRNVAGTTLCRYHPSLRAHPAVG